MGSLPITSYSESFDRCPNFGDAAIVSENDRKKSQPKLKFMYDKKYIGASVGVWLMLFRKLRSTQPGQVGSSVLFRAYDNLIKTAYLPVFGLRVGDSISGQPNSFKTGSVGGVQLFFNIR